MLEFQHPVATDDMDLSRRERQVMELFHRLGQGTAEEILAELPDPPTNSAIRSTLRILEQKGRIRHTRRNRSYVYRPVASARTARRKALRRVIDTFFEGSTSRALASLLDDGVQLSTEDVDDIERLIERARKEGR